MTRNTRNLVRFFVFSARRRQRLCPGDRRSQSTTEIVDDSLIANKASWRSIATRRCMAGDMGSPRKRRGRVNGVVASAEEAQRAMQIAQQVKGVKAVHNRLRVQEGRPEPALAPPRVSPGKTRQEARDGERRTRLTCNAERGAGFAVPLVFSHRDILIM